MTTPTTPPTHTPATYNKPTMQVICLTTTDGISHEFFGPSLLRNTPDGHTGQPASIQSVNFGPELTIQQVQEILTAQTLHSFTLN